MVSLDEFVHVDEHLISSEINTEDEILESVSKKQDDLEDELENRSDDADDSEGTPREKPSDAEVLMAIETIQLAFSMNEAATNDGSTLICLIRQKYESYRPKK
ncbi:unnamed protein product [Acanthoscelides obtectus]|uniref:Uncharacterized protein n=1 Tax=Acanthoscelides obtectus TaxID=200917 RepID=A0A9P0P6X8_ACAOB|nr:unnamed protein product [Acanthoscelides obtectus]CAK1666384.1 hypothetical protein AOBTE_LOCUS25289 [Acanthoscelides obtectus]